MNPVPTSDARRVQRVRHELRRRELQVARVEPLGARFVAVTFAGEALADFVSLGFDDHVKFMFPGGDGQLQMRDYTPRRFDAAARELVIEFALHGHGRASAWAAAARPGDAATIGGPRGSMVVPTDYDWHLLAGDAAALPAIHRRVEELPAGTRAIVVVHEAEAAERRQVPSAAAAQWHWVDTSRALVDALRALSLPAGEGYAWAAGEARLMAEVRGVLLAEKGHPREAARIAAYWKLGVAAHHENLA